MNKTSIVAFISCILTCAVASQSCKSQTPTTSTDSSADSKIVDASADVSGEKKEATEKSEVSGEKEASSETDGGAAKKETQSEAKAPDKKASGGEKTECKSDGKDSDKAAADKSGGKQAADNKADDKQERIKKGRALYRTHCSSCHPGGTNTVTKSKPLVGSTYLKSYPTFKAYLDQPLGDMPHYDHLLKDEDLIGALYLYA